MHTTINFSVVAEKQINGKVSRRLIIEFFPFELLVSPKAERSAWSAIDKVKDTEKLLKFAENHKMPERMELVQQSSPHIPVSLSR